MKPQTHNKNTIIINRKNQKRTAETQKTQRNYVFLFTSAFFCAFVVGIRIKSPSPRQTRATPRPHTGKGSGVRANHHTSAKTSATRINNTPSPIRIKAILLLLVVDGALLKIGVAGNAFGWLPVDVEPYDWG